MNMSVFKSVFIKSAIIALCIVSAGCNLEKNWQEEKAYVTIGGTMTGLTSGTIQLVNNGKDRTSVTSNGAFKLSLSIANGSDYAVSVAVQPNDLTCTVANANGTATADVTSVSVSCAPYSFSRRPLPSIYSTGKAINYSPYRTAGGPGILEVPTDAQILEDLGLLDEAGYNLLRLFGAAPPATDVVSEKILQLANQHYPHIKFQLGVFLGGVPDVIPVTCTNPDPTLDNSKNIAYLITKLSKYPNVVSISVGNETSFYSKYMPVECLGRYIKTIRAQVTQPVTADDDFTFYAGLSWAGGDRAGYKPDDILALLDFAAIHMYPFSNSSWEWQQTSTVAGPARAQKTMETSLDVAKDWFNRVATYSFNDNGQTKTVAQAMPIVIGETGWKARQTNYSSALESYLAKPVNAKWYTDLLYGNAAKGYASWEGSANGPATIFYFQAFDETWKGTDDGWGLWDINRVPRYALCGLVSSVVCNADLYQGAGYYQTDTVSSCLASICTINFSEPTVALVEFGGLGVEVANDPTDATNKVGKLTKLTSSQVWAGTTVHLNGSASTNATVTRIDPAQGITLRVYSPAVGETIMVKIENGANSGVFKESSVTTTVANQWQTLTFAYPTADANAVYNKVSVFPAFLISNADKVFYIDELKYTEKTSSSSSSSSSSFTVPTNAPSTATPGGAVVVYSDASVTTGFNGDPNWDGGSGTVYEGEFSIAGNKVLKYSNLNYQGMEFNGINVSAKTTLHADFWTPNLTGIEISLISLGPTVENAIAKVLTPNAWNSIDIPLSSYSANKSAIRQIKLVATGGGTIYVDNIYFY